VVADAAADVADHRAVVVVVVDAAVDACR
jgi:hypothetical protein